MRVFLTGASGYIGSAVARELVRAGHEVTGMHHAAGTAEMVGVDRRRIYVRFREAANPTFARRCVAFERDDRATHVRDLRPCRYVGDEDL